MLAHLDRTLCISCSVCVCICPTLAIEQVGKTIKIDHNLCFGCQNCQQRCPVGAIKMIKRTKELMIQVEVRASDSAKIKEICQSAKMNRKQIICYCTTTRAEEVAQAIILGANTPEKISQMTGIRSGCKVECIQPILRLLRAAGIEPLKPKGYQWYGLTPTIWDISDKIITKYNNHGFYFEADRSLMEKMAQIENEEEGILE